MKKELAECVGLWLAEGDNKSIAEITFTNNELCLIIKFDRCIRKLFKKHSLNNIRIYVYSPNKNKSTIPLKNCKINYYIDKRASKAYFIWRLASRDLNRKWKKIVEDIKNDPKNQINILRGFFAGEGNIKNGMKSNRVIRISQGKRNEFIEKILNNLNVRYSYSFRERSYIISNKLNWDILAKINIAELHTIKKSKFWKVYAEFKEEHYKKGYIQNNLLKLLKNPLITRDLAGIFNRSFARIQDVLIQLKKSELIENFRVKNKDYWIRKDQNLIIISRIKKRYLDLLKKPKRNYEIANYLGVTRRSVGKRLKELERLRLIKRNLNKEWIKVQNNKRVVVK